MIDDERPEAQAGGIADPQPAAKRLVERHGAVAALGLRHAIDQIGDELANHPDRQHFHSERAAETGPAGIAMPVGNAELAVAVDRRRPHDIADIVEPRRLRLPARRQTADNMIEQPRALVGAGQDQVGMAKATGLLLRRIGAQTLDLAVVGDTVIQDVGGVPGLGDHPVGPHRRVEVVGEADQRIGPVGASGRVDSNAHAVVADFPALVAEPESGGPDMPQHRPQETQPRLVKRAEPGQAHDLLRRPQMKAAPRTCIFNRTEFSEPVQIRPSAARRRCS